MKNMILVARSCGIFAHAVGNMAAIREASKMEPKDAKSGHSGAKLATYGPFYFVPRHAGKRQKHCFSQ